MKIVIDISEEVYNTIQTIVAKDFRKLTQRDFVALIYYADSLALGKIVEKEEERNGLDKQSYT